MLFHGSFRVFFESHDDAAIGQRALLRQVTTKQPITGRAAPVLLCKTCKVVAGMERRMDQNPVFSSILTRKSVLVMKNGGFRLISGPSDRPWCMRVVLQGFGDTKLSYFHVGEIRTTGEIRYL